MAFGLPNVCRCVNIFALPEVWPSQQEPGWADEAADLLTHPDKSMHTYPKREKAMADNSKYYDDVDKFSGNVNNAAVDAIVKYCGIALRSKDASLVSCTDPVELGRVRDGFASKKLGLAGDAADKAIAAVCEKMKDDRQKNRVTFYYLLAEETGTMSALA